LSFFTETEKLCYYPSTYEESENRHMKKTLAACVVATSLLFGVSIKAHALESEPFVQVKLVNYLGNKSAITLVPTGEYVTSEGSLLLKSGVTYTLKSENGHINLYQEATFVTNMDTVTLKPFKESNSLSINNRPYAGNFSFSLENNQYIRPVNIVYMEDYLKGVVPIEMYASWNVEALKTQAVAARTYAMPYTNSIINDTVSYQAYGGKVWQESSNSAVDSTTGQTLTYNGKYISAVFSASNGGVTESNSTVWGGTALSYLPIQQDPYDAKTPWSVSFAKKQIDTTGKDVSNPDSWWSTTKETDSVISTNIKTWLQSNGYENKDIKIVNIPTFALYEKTASGRVNKGDITIEFYAKDLKDAQGKLVLQKVALTGAASSKIRSIIGTRSMLSYLVDSIDTSSSIVKFTGKGDGHAVGMSQWGAKNRADAGQTYKDILNFYYPGTLLTTSYTAHSLDKTAPVISNVSPSYIKDSQTITLSYSIDKVSAVSIIAKDTNGNVVANLQKETVQSAGNGVISWDVTGVSDGTYTFDIIATDGNDNRSTSSVSYSLFKPKTGTVTASSLSVRSGPGTSYSILGYVKLNQTVSIIGMEGNWYLIQYGTGTGYVSATYITNVN